MKELTHKKSMLTVSKINFLLCRRTRKIPLHGLNQPKYKR